MIRKMSGFLAASLAMGMTLVAAAPVAAQTSRQKNKNLMRNLGIGLGAAAVHQAVKGKKTNAIILGAGAAYSAKRYEDHRKAQARENRNRSRRVSRAYRSGSSSHPSWHVATHTHSNGTKHRHGHGPGHHR